MSLIVVGSGPHKEKLEGLVDELNLRDNIKLMGHLSSEDKEKLLGTSQALVFPSLIEGFGLVILEAFEFGKPVLVPNIRPLSDIVSDNVTGLVIPPHDEAKWAKAMELIIREPQRGIEMGHAGRQMLEKKYNTQIMHQKIVKMYDEMTKR